MRIGKFDTFSRSVKEESDDPSKKLIAVMFSTIRQKAAEIIQAINGNLTFGDGSSPDNIAGKFLTYSSNGTPDTEDVVDHSLGVVPIGFLTIRPPGNGTINIGTTAWTTQYLYLKCSAASQTAKIFVLPPPRS